MDWTLSTCGGSCLHEKRITIYAYNYQPKRGNVLAPSCGVQLFSGRPCFFCFVVVVVVLFFWFFGFFNKNSLHHSCLALNGGMENDPH